MAYAQKADIDQLYGADYVADLLEEGIDADTAATDALGRASAEIDVHLCVRYELPLKTMPQALVMPCVNIAIYDLALSHGALTEAIRDRYKDAIDMLKRIADGKAGLGPDEPRVTSDPEASDSGASFSANGRLFSRETL